MPHRVFCLRSRLTPLHLLCPTSHFPRHFPTRTTGGSRSDAANLSRRLRKILLESPHLIRFIRCLRVSFEPTVLVHLTELQLTHVDTIILCPSTAGRISAGASLLAAPMIALPSIRGVRLLSITFDDITSLCTLFHQRTSPLDSVSMDYIRVYDSPATSALHVGEHSGTRRHLTVNSFEIDQGLSPEFLDWVGHPYCPLDFAGIEELHVGHQTSAGIINVMRAAQSSLHTLRIEASNTTPGFRLSDLRALKRLDISATFGKAGAIVALLASADTDMHLEQLSVRVYFFGTLDEESLCRLDDAIARLRAPLRAVHVTVRLIGKEVALHMQDLRALFPRLDGRGYLEISPIASRIKHL
ncbi:hypothetical protein B0H19DRAFT_186435 [Mycena capillaripes]|nr:hypothetical protein B0H19DRAFT_186435 [Mycena capillaripes]